MVRLLMQTGIGSGTGGDRVPLRPRGGDAGGWGEGEGKGEGRWKEAVS